MTSDSRGHNFDEEIAAKYMSEAFKAIVNFLELNPEISEKVEVYSFKNKRQNDFVSCPIFSIHDLKTLSNMDERSDETIFDFISSFSEPVRISENVSLASYLNIFEVGMLTPEMMKPTQSYTQIREYIKQSPRLERPMTPALSFRFSPSESPFLEMPKSARMLEECTTTYRCRTPKKAGFENRYADYKRFTYITKIVRYLLDA